MTKKIALFVFGGLLIAAGLLYGFGGILESSIPQRSANIARWERDVRETGEKARIALAEADRLGKQPATAGDEPSPFERQLAHVERLTSDMRFTNEMIDHERGRKRIMIIATAIFVAAGILAMLLGWRVRRKIA